MSSLKLLFSCLLLANAAFAGSYLTGTTTQLFDYPDGTVELGDGSVIGSDGVSGAGGAVAGVFGGALRLADMDSTNAIGSFKLPDLDPGNVARTFDLRFLAKMNALSNAAPGEGWSINFGDIPEDNGTGEGGFAPLPGGLTIAFDTLNNGEEEAPSIAVYVGGTVITNIPRTFTFDGVGRVVVIHWDAAGLDLTYDNRAVFLDLRTPGFAPREKNRFAFSARTTTNTMEVVIDEVRATTTALPVIDTGGAVISEFVVDNGDFEDEFADKSAWIELFNGSNQPIDLTGWYLTDSKRSLMKWRIPGLVLNPYNYQVVFASGRNRPLTTNSFLHAGFNLSESDEYVALVRPDGTVASGYDFGPQEESVSFGESGTERARGYMYPATPGGVNTAKPELNSFAPPVQFSHPGGFVEGPITVSLAVPAQAAAEIRYTLDRTEPGLASPIYTNPITVTQFTTIRARAYLTNHLPGRVTRGTYVLMDGTLTNYAGTGKVFDSNLPLIFLDSFGIGVDGSTGGSRPYRSTYALVIPPDPATGRASLTNRPEYNGSAGTHVRGESSAGFEQKSYALEFWDESGRDLDAPVLGMPSNSDWVLYGPWSEKTLMRNKLIFDWMLAMRGHDGTAMRTRFVELFFNQVKPPNGRVGYTSYRGVYVLMEKIKRGSKRVPLENLNDKTIDPELITGGYIIRKDKDDALKNNWSTPRVGIPLQSFDPDRMNTTQLNYMKNYLTSFETALMSANARNFTTGYQAYIDADTFIDVQWMTEIAKQVDGYVFSTYYHKDRGGRLRAGPLWDFNIALGNADYGTGDRPTNWLYDVANGVGQLWFPRLHTDLDYKVAHWDRYWQLRRSIFKDEEIMAVIDRHMTNLLDGYTGAVSNRAPASIQNPVARHYRKYPRLAIRDWPNPPGVTKNTTWQLEVDYMKNWIRPRFAWLDDQSLRAGRLVYRPPVLSHEGGMITEGVQVAITPYQRGDAVALFPAGDIYYTLDNSDPRVAGGEISSTARRYTGPVVVDSARTINARLYTTNRIWSPLATATYFLGAVPASASNVVISEVMFRPAALGTGELAAGLVDFNRCEFVELRNIAGVPVDLTGVKFVNGIEFDFEYVPVASRLLKAGESAVIVADKRAFRVRYPLVPVAKILGQFGGNLDSGGETLELQAADGSAIDEFRYDDDAPWPTAGDGTGRSLILKLPTANLDPADPAQWTMSAKSNGTPGRSGIGADVFTGDPMRDTDGDGQTDFFEFASGSDPENPGSAYYPEVGVEAHQVNGTANNYLTFTFTRQPSVPGVRFTIETSRDLAQWGAAESTLLSAGNVAHQDGSVTEVYRGVAPIAAEPATARFYRVRAQQQ